YITTCLAAVNRLIAVLNAARVIGMHHGDFNIADSLRSTFVHLGKLFRTLLAEPSHQFWNSNDDGIVLFDYFDCIADVISMAVRAEKNIDFFQFLLSLRAHGIPHDPRIDDHGFASGGFDTKCGMTEPRKLESLQIHDENELLAVLLATSTQNFQR